MGRPDASQIPLYSQGINGFCTLRQKRSDRNFNTTLFLCEKEMAPVSGEGSHKINRYSPRAGQQRRHRHKELTFGQSGRRRAWDDLREQHWNIHITICKIASGSLMCEAGSPKPALCDNLEGWGGLGRAVEGLVQEGGDTYVCLQLIHVDVWQKRSQYCQAIILQLK